MECLLSETARTIPRHPARASCCDALCGLARSLNQALRAQSPRPASQGSPAPRPATANAFASLSPRAKPSRSNLPSLRARRRRESAAIVPLPPYRQPRASGVERLALLARRIVQGRSPARPHAPQPREEHPLPATAAAAARSAAFWLGENLRGCYVGAMHPVPNSTKRPARRSTSLRSPTPVSLL